MANTFRPERLVYRAIKNNYEDIKFLPSLNQDSEGRIRFSRALFKPASKEHAQNDADTMRKAFFSAIVCISIPWDEKIDYPPDFSDLEPLLEGLSYRGLGETFDSIAVRRLQSSFPRSISGKDTVVKPLSGYRTGLSRWRDCIMWGLAAFPITLELGSCMDVWDLRMRVRRESQFDMMVNGMVLSSWECSRVSGELGMRKRRARVGARRSLLMAGPRQKQTFLRWNKRQSRSHIRG